MKDGDLLNSETPPLNVEVLRSTQCMPIHEKIEITNVGISK